MKGWGEEIEERGMDIEVDKGGLAKGVRRRG